MSSYTALRTERRIKMKKGTTKQNKREREKRRERGKGDGDWKRERAKGKEVLII